MTEPALTNHRDYMGADDPQHGGEFDEAEELPGRRISRLSILLGLVLLLGGAFTGGVLTQKHHDKGLTSSRASAGPGAGGFPAGLGFGSGGPPGVTGSGAAGTGTGAAGTGAASTTTAGSSTSSTPVLVGTVVSSKDGVVTVKDLGGTTHRVRTSTSTTVTVTGGSAVGSLAPGSTVSVSGTKAADGSVSASNVTAR